MELEGKKCFLFFFCKSEMATHELLDIVPTKAMRLQKSQTDFKATVFESHKSKAKTSSGLNLKRVATSSSGILDATNEFDLKRAKNEVFHFGISGFDSADKHAAKLALAVRLGAKPPKNSYRNYKELVAEKEQSRKQASEETARLQLGKNAQGGASVTYKKIHTARKKKKLNGQITTHYGVVNPKMTKKKFK